MIYLDNITDAQSLLIPRNGESVSGEMELHLTSTIEKKGFEVDVTDMNTSVLYFNLAIILPESLPGGEYEYQLRKDGKVLSNGLLYLGNFSHPHENNIEITYKEYGK